jgi:hypothetical protein
VSGAAPDVAATIGEVLHDLTWIAGRLPVMGPDEAIVTARILDRLSTECAEAAAGLRSSAPEGQVPGDA